MLRVLGDKEPEVGFLCYGCGQLFRDPGHFMECPKIRKAVLKDQEIQRERTHTTNLLTAKRNMVNEFGLNFMRNYRCSERR